MGTSQLALFLARRLIGLVAVLFVISFGIFSLQFAAPGSVEQVLIGTTRPGDPEVIAAIRERYHLDEPFLAQYGLWLKGAFSLDFGVSSRTSESVLTMLGERVSLTAFLGCFAFILVLSIGIPLGMLAGIKKRTPLDRAAVSLSVLGVSAPAFVTGVFLLYLFAVVFGWFPAFGQGEGFLDQLWHLTLPAIALALTGIAPIVKFTRTGMIQALDQDFVVAARARGLSRRRVYLGYGLRNALIPVVTASGLILGVMLTGAALVEVTFALPGLGSLLIQSVNVQDVQVVQGLAMLAATLVLLVNLLTDVLYLFIDPRIRFSRADA
ncbi:MAG: ABC transporter permease [Actinomycetota bacterium]|nr:ABC transporter permease [Actinomycetota bacterium]MDQ3732459.1 ABC transporter permease [Actinomycetota bacterium]